MIIFRFIGFIFVGKEFFDTRQTKFFTLLGTCKLQIAFHNNFRYAGSNWPGCEFWYSCCKKVYPDFTVYSLVGVKGQVRVSAWSVWHKGIFLIMSTSKRSKLASKTSSFHILCLLSIRKLTLALAKAPVQGDTIFGECFTRR